MPVTFKRFKDIVAPYAGKAGKCADSETVEIFSRGVMEYLLYEGSTAAIRRMEAFSYNRALVLPPEVEVPLKVRINGTVSEVWNKWANIEAPGGMDFDGPNCWSAQEVLAETGAYSPLAYPLPPNGAVIGIKATCDESIEARVIVSGVDTTGREIYTSNSRGEQVVGEEFTLEKNVIKYGRVTFGRVTGVLKAITQGYVQVYAVCPKTQRANFLGDWRPSDTVPMYRTYNILGNRCGPISHLSILFRAKLKDTYVDNELTLFDNVTAIMMAAQRLQAEGNNDLEVANYKREAGSEMLENEAQYKRKGNGPLFVFQPLSGGSIRNFVRSRVGRSYWGGNS